MLEYLNLTGNRVQAVNWYLKNCTRLRLVNLSHNAIEQISDNFTHNQMAPVNYKISSSRNVSSSSLEIDLSGNPLSCLCNASSFLRWIQSNTEIIFTGLLHYVCLYPNGTWLNLTTIDAHQLDSQCQIIDDIKNNTDCPCDISKLKLLYNVRYSLAEHYCFYPDGKLIQMKMLNPDFAAKACLTKIPMFLFSVVVSVSVLVIAIVTTVFVVIYRRKRRREFDKLLACLNPMLITEMLMRRLSEEEPLVEEEIQAENRYDAYFSYVTDRKSVV